VKGSGRRMALLSVLVLALVVAARTDVLVAAWKELAGLIGLEGEPVAASPAIISGHEVQEIEALGPQEQAERLLERAINHYDGAAALIASSVDGWRGKITMEGRLSGLFMTALNANDLRVRAAGLELYLASYDIGKLPEDLDKIMARGERQAESRPHALFVAGLLGNRGVDPRRALDYLLRFAGDPDVETRKWAVEGISMLGTDDAIAPLLRIFHDDPSAVVRERAGCGLAQSGMLTAKQRFTAIPELLRFADDPAVDDKTHAWVFQALADISGQRLGYDIRDWRDWWAKRPQPPEPDAR
jgi:HEAT repeat protein